MKSGCLGNFIFAVLIVLAFGFSSYVWFTFFIRGKSVSTPNLIGKSVDDAKAICSDLGIELSVDAEHRRSSDKVAAGNIVWQNRAPGATNLVKRGTKIKVELSTGPLILRVPDFSGERRSGTAVLRLAQQNLKAGSVTNVDGAQQGVLAADPPKGTVRPASRSGAAVSRIARPDRFDGQVRGLSRNPRWHNHSTVPASRREGECPGPDYDRRQPSGGDCDHRAAAAGLTP